MLKSLNYIKIYFKIHENLQIFINHFKVNFTYLKINIFINNVKLNFGLHKNLHIYYQYCQI